MMDYEPNRYSTGRYIKHSRDLRNSCEDAAEQIATVARAIAPRRTGEYADSITVVSPADVSDRVGAGVQSDDPAAAPLEFGNQIIDERTIFTDAAVIAGFDVDFGG